MTTRRTLFRAALAAVALPLGSLLAKKPGIIIDCRSPDWDLALTGLYHAFLNGREVHEVFYVDTGRGILKTNAVLDPYRPLPRCVSTGIATWEMSPAQRARGLSEGWDMPEDGVVSRTLYGRVTLHRLGSPLTCGT